MARIVSSFRRSAPLHSTEHHLTRPSCASQVMARIVTTFPLASRYGTTRGMALPRNPMRGMTWLDRTEPDYARLRTAQQGKDQIILGEAYLDSVSPHLAALGKASLCSTP